MKRKLKRKILEYLQVILAILVISSFSYFIYHEFIVGDNSEPSLLSLCLAFSVFLHLVVRFISKLDIKDLKFAKETVEAKLKKYTFLKLDKQFVSSIRQYLVFFSNYVKDSKQVDITMHASEVEGGLDIAFDFPETTTKEELQTWLDEYLGFLTTDKNDFQVNTVAEVTNEQADVLILRLRNQVQSFRHSLDILRVENSLLKSQNEQIADITKLLASKSDQIFIPIGNHNSLSKEQSNTTDNKHDS